MEFKDFLVEQISHTSFFYVTCPPFFLVLTVKRKTEKLLHLPEIDLGSTNVGERFWPFLVLRRGGPTLFLQTLHLIGGVEVLDFQTYQGRFNDGFVEM